MFICMECDEWSFELPESCQNCEEEKIQEQMRLMDPTYDTGWVTDWEWRKFVREMGY